MIPLRISSFLFTKKKKLKKWTKSHIFNAAMTLRCFSILKFKCDENMCNLNSNSHSKSVWRKEINKNIAFLCFILFLTWIDLKII